MHDDDVSLLRCRKPWYQRALEMATPWKIMASQASPAPRKERRLRSPDAPDAYRPRPPPGAVDGNRRALRKSASLRVATSLTRVCLCGPISSYNEILRHDVPPRRSYSYPRSRAFPAASPPSNRQRAPSARPSTEVRRVFRGKSLTDDVLMRRFVAEEEAMMQIRRRNEMEIIRKRSLNRRKKIGRSPLSSMVLAEDGL